MQTIVTHNGNFHPDELFAIATLQLYLRPNNTKIVRSRDKDTINNADWVVDVGGVYNPGKHRFDHHQPGAPVREDGTPYSSFGLVWREYGHIVAGSRDVSQVIERVLVKPIDAGDNGVSLYDLKFSDLSPFELYNVIDLFRPVWGSDEDVDKCFTNALLFVRGLLERMIKKEHSKLIQKKVAERYYLASEDKTVIVCEENISPDFFIKFPDVKVIVYKTNRDSEIFWKAQAVRKTEHGFDIRAKFPESWGGLSGGELERVSGISEAVFCHRGLFLFVARTRAAAIAAAHKAVVIE